MPGLRCGAECRAATYEYNAATTWYTKSAAALPLPPLYGTPSCRYNLCVDHVMALPFKEATGDETRFVTVLFQEAQQQDGGTAESELLRQLAAELERCGAVGGHMVLVRLPRICCSARGAVKACRDAGATTNGSDAAGEYTTESCRGDAR